LYHNTLSLAELVTTACPTNRIGAHQGQPVARPPNQPASRYPHLGIWRSIPLV